MRIRFSLRLLAMAIAGVASFAFAEPVSTPIQGVTTTPLPSIISAAPPSAALPVEGVGTPAASTRAGYNPNVFNPAMGLVLDSALSNTTKNRGSIDFRSAEVNLAAAVDPFANLYGIFNGTPDGVEVEEAFFMTTSLPYNLTLRGGRMFASFGRLAHWHDHELPFVNRVNSLDRFVGGEAQADGLELIHLFKTPFFLQGTLGAYNKLGADNARLEQTDGNGNGHVAGRPWPGFTYLGRLFSYLPIGDDYGLDIGVSEAITPKQYYINGIRADREHSARSLTGVDLTFRWLPLTENVFRKLTWGSEFFLNNELQQVNTDADTDAPIYGRKSALGGYSYVEWRFSHWWSVGPFYDYAERLEAPGANDQTFGAALNLYASEFQRWRLQYSKIKANDGTPDDDQVFLQWFVTIGSHVHVFKDR